MDTEKLIESLAGEGARKPMMRPLLQMALWLAGTLIWVAFVAGHMGLRPDIAAKMAQPFYLPELVLLSLLSVSAALAALCLARPDGYHYPWMRHVPPVLLACWAAVAAAGMAWTAPPLPPEILDPAQFDCTRCILQIAVPPGIAMFLMVRGGAPVRAGGAGFMSALSVASLAYLCMRLVEPNDSPFHLLLWHAAPVLVLCLAGLALGRAFLRLR